MVLWGRYWLPGIQLISFITILSSQEYRNVVLYHDLGAQILLRPLTYVAICFTFWNLIHFRYYWNFEVFHYHRVEMLLLSSSAMK